MDLAVFVGKVVYKIRRKHNFSCDDAAELTSAQVKKSFCQIWICSTRSSPAYGASRSRSQVPTVLYTHACSSGELDVISDSCLVLGAVRLRQCVSREQELTWRIISIPRKFA